ncbi:MAG: GGDEF domain-containing protein [Dehalococcoidia bacterium]
MDITSDRRYPTDMEGVHSDQEVSDARLALYVGIATIVLAVLAIGFVILTQASATWHYVGDGILIALPLLLGIPTAAYIYERRVSRLQRFQTQLLGRTRELEMRATHDELTQLYNRRYFYERLQEALNNGRITKQPVALMLLDVDGLKRINDDYGHQVGDVILRNFAQVLAKQVRSGDVPGRLGGDEFGVIMPDSGKRGAYALARRLWQALQETPIYQVSDVTLHLGVSIGISGFPWSGDNVDQLTHWADSDMYANKVSQRLPDVPAGETAPDLEAAPSDYA